MTQPTRRPGWVYWGGWPLIFLLSGLALLLLYASQGGVPFPPAITGILTDTPQAHPSPSPTSGLVPTPPRSAPAPTQNPSRPPSPAEYSAIRPDPRLGFSLSSNAAVALWAERLGASWYIDWQATDTIAGPLEHWKMVRVTSQGYHPSLREIQEIARQQPGKVWILGNEPDVIWQDNIPPEKYAEAYHQLYDTIKGADPTASLAVGGVAQGTPLRFQYLDRVLQAYQSRYGTSLPADWWTVHGYVLREQHDSWGVEIPPGLKAEDGILYEISDHGRLDYFEKQLRDFRAWMVRNGYQDVPLALTEFGILMPAEYGFPPDFVVNYLRSTFQLLATMRDPSTGYSPDDYHLVQRWGWFSLEDSTYSTSNLADLQHDRLTPVGEAFRNYVLTVSQQ